MRWAGPATSFSRSETQLWRRLGTRGAPCVSHSTPLSYLGAGSVGRETTRVATASRVARKRAAPLFHIRASAGVHQTRALVIFSVSFLAYESAGEPTYTGARPPPATSEKKNKRKEHSCRRRRGHRLTAEAFGTTRRTIARVTFAGRATVARARPLGDAARIATPKRRPRTNIPDQICVIF